MFPDSIAKKTIEKLEDICDSKAFSDGSVKGLQAAMKAADIAISAAMPVVTKPSQFETINRFAKQITDETEGSAQRIISFGGIHPDSQDYKKELKQIKELGLPGVKIHPAYQGTYITDPRYLRIIDYAQELGLWVLVHAGKDPLVSESYCTPKDALSLIRKVGGEKLILAHMGGLGEADAVEEYLIGEHVYIDTSMGFSFLTPERMAKMIREHGADRVLFGSDSPWSSMKTSIDRIREFGLTKEEEDAIFRKNAEKVLQKKSGS